jgi:hypothetical protein
MFAQFIANAESLAASMLSIGLTCWAIRKKYEFDEVLSPLARITRWLVVAVTFLIVTFPVSQITHLRIGITRVTIGIICISFFCWPNLANRLLHEKSELDIQ